MGWYCHCSVTRPHLSAREPGKLLSLPRMGKMSLGKGDPETQGVCADPRGTSTLPHLRTRAQARARGSLMYTHVCSDSGSLTRALTCSDPSRFMCARAQRHAQCPEAGPRRCVPAHVHTSPSVSDLESTSVLTLAGLVFPGGEGPCPSGHGARFRGWLSAGKGECGLKSSQCPACPAVGPGPGGRGCVHQEDRMPLSSCIRDAVRTCRLWPANGCLFSHLHEMHCGLLALPSAWAGHLVAEALAS